MSKNVLIVSASPRKGGNSDLLCDQFIQGVLESKNQVEKIFLKDIIYICKIKGSKYIKYVTAETIYTERLPINQIFDNICNNAFIFADRGHILNMNHIKRLRGTSVYMDNGDEIIVNRVQCMQIKEKIMEYWRVSR